jgi:hypothetical protein
MYSTHDYAGLKCGICATHNRSVDYDDGDPPLGHLINTPATVWSGWLVSGCWRAWLCWLSQCDCACG